MRDCALRQDDCRLQANLSTYKHAASPQQLVVATKPLSLLYGLATLLLAATSLNGCSHGGGDDGRGKPAFKVPRHPLRPLVNALLVFHADDKLPISTYAVNQTTPEGTGPQPASKNLAACRFSREVQAQKRTSTVPSGAAPWANFIFHRAVRHSNSGRGAIRIH